MVILLLHALQLPAYPAFVECDATGPLEAGTIVTPRLQNGSQDLLSPGLFKRALLNMGAERFFIDSIKYEYEELWCLKVNEIV